MRTFYYLTIAVLIIALLPVSNAIAQDTTSVQTFTFSDITKRRDIYEFPSADKEWRKILMYKTLKCDPATTQDNFDCGEWDYLTYTYVYDHTGVMDSNAATHPFFLAGGENIDTAHFHTTPMYDVYQREQWTLLIDSVINETTTTFANGGASSTEVLASDAPVSRFQFLITASELMGSGLLADTINRIQLNISQLGSELENFRIRMANTTLLSLTALSDVNLSTVYESNTEFTSTGLQTINLTEPFAWNGGQGLVVEISFENDQAGSAHTVVAETQADSNCVFASGNDGYAEFTGGNRIEVPLTGIDFGDEVTVSFWSYGDPNALPSNTSVFEAADINENRALNVHLPWSNGTVYWDAGEGSGYDRIQKAAGGNIYSGRWVHWAFTKNGSTGEMKIYLNGSLWHSGVDKNRTLGIMKNLWIGRGRNSFPYEGKIDEFRMWKRELSASEIEDWRLKEITPSHPNYNDLVVYLKFNDGYNLVNDAPGGMDAFWHGSPTVANYTGSEIFMNQERTDVMPEFHFLQGEYLSTPQVDTVNDTVAHAPYSIVEYTVNGNEAVATSGSYPFREGYTYVYDPNGNAIDSTWHGATQTQVNSELSFFYPPFEVIDRYEIGRFITPYGIGLSLGPDGFTWVYDVTDYAFLLQDSVDISTGNQQELVDLRFEMIEGTPPAPVVEFDRPWGQSRSIRYSDMDDDSALEPTTIDVHPDAARQKVITRLTGHGHNSNTGNFPHCCEWRDNTHYMFVNNQLAAEWHIWQTNDCAFNPVYPQGGTWPGAREGWCPGDLVKDFEFDYTSLVSGNSYELDYRITPVPTNNQGMGNGSYVTAMHVIQYGEPAHDHDAELYNVLRPTDRGYYSRQNPVCFAPSVVIRNNGDEPLTSVKITYQVSGGVAHEYVWTGSLGFMEKAEVELPFENGAFYVGDGTNRFMATVSEPNGQADGYADNDTYITNFDLPPLYEEKVIIQYQTNTFQYDNDLFVYDANNNVVFSRIGAQLQPNNIYWDTLELDSGCYRLELTDASNDGLSYWAWPNQGSGFLRLWSASGGILQTFESEFGHKIEHAFSIDSLSYPGYVDPMDTTGTDPTDTTGTIGIGNVLGDQSLTVYPNPNTGSFVLEMLNYQGQHQLEIISLTGRTVYSEQLNVKGAFAWRYDLDLPSGFYTVRLSQGAKSETVKMIISR